MNEDGFYEPSDDVVRVLRGIRKTLERIEKQKNELLDVIAEQEVRIIAIETYLEGKEKS